MIMQTSNGDVYPRIVQVTKAWSTLRPNRSFSGLTLDQFNKGVEPSHRYRAEIDDLQARLELAKRNCEDADKVSRKLLQRVVNAVRGDADEGEDGELYSAMGYLPRSVRISLRTVGRKAAAAAKKEGGADGSG
jgi:hypothetical protein